MNFVSIIVLGLTSFMSFSVQAAGNPTFNEFMKNKNTSYQMIFEQQDANFEQFKVVNCIEGIVRNDFKQHPDPTYNNSGSIQVKGTPELMADITIKGKADGTADVETEAVYAPASAKGGGFSIGGRILIFGSNLKGIIGTAGKVREDGLAYRPAPDDQNDHMKVYIVEIVLNPKANCAARSK